METRLLVYSVVTMATLVGARAGIIYGVYTSPSLIPDNNAVGCANKAVVSNYPTSIIGVGVKLNISGGFNGDLYAYLSHEGVLLPLLNRVGVTGNGGGNDLGYADKGLSMMFRSDGAYEDIHFYQNHSPTYESGQLTGTWQPDGRNIDPLSARAAFDTADRLTFASFNGLNPNGTWTLFIADLSPGAQSQFVSWELSITAVPEPVDLALGFLAGTVLAASLARKRSNWRRKLF